MDIDRMNTNLETVTPVKLATRYEGSLPVTLTTQQAKEIVYDPDWDLTGWDKPEIFEELIKSPQKPSPAKALPYEFDWEDKTTQSILIRLNSIRLGEYMRSRVFKLLHPDRSCLHPKYGPFTAQYSSNKQHKIAVFNCKDKRALVCEADTFLLDPCCQNFDLTDNNTYFTLCNWDPNTVWIQAQRAVACQKAGFGKSSGPYTLSYKKSNPPSITIHSIKGGRHTFKCNPKTPPPDKTKTATEVSTPGHNRFSILAKDEDVQEDNTGDTSINGKHTLLAPQQPTTSHHKRLRQLSKKTNKDIPSQQATQHHPAGSPPYRDYPDQTRSN